MSTTTPESTPLTSHQHCSTPWKMRSCWGWSWTMDMMWSVALTALMVTVPMVHGRPRSSKTWWWDKACLRPKCYEEGDSCILSQPCLPICVLQFCEVITVSWLKHLSAQVVRIMLDYTDHVSFCTKLKESLEGQKQWPEICQIQSKICHDLARWLIFHLSV